MTAESNCHSKLWTVMQQHYFMTHLYTTAGAGGIHAGHTSSLVGMQEAKAKHVVAC